MGILQARIQEWVAIPFSRGSSWPRDGTCSSCIAGGHFTTEPPGTSSYHSSVQFSSVAQSCPTLRDPMNHSTQAFLSITNSQNSLRLTSIESVMPSSKSYTNSANILCLQLYKVPSPRAWRHREEWAQFLPSRCSPSTYIQHTDYSSTMWSETARTHTQRLDKSTLTMEHTPRICHCHQFPTRDQDPQTLCLSQPPKRSLLKLLQALYPSITWNLSYKIMVENLNPRARLPTRRHLCDCGKAT